MKVEREKVPVVDISKCLDCGGCLEVCPMVFWRNEMGYVEVADLPQYSQAAIQEVINICPADCIVWEETLGFPQGESAQPPAFYWEDRFLMLSPLT